MKKDFNFKIGDIVNVAQIDKPEVASDGQTKKDRIANFKGKIIKIRGQGPSQTFTVRAELEGVTVEKIIPTSSPLITDIKLVEKPKKAPRRARLYIDKTK